MLSKTRGSRIEGHYLGKDISNLTEQRLEDEIARAERSGDRAKAMALSRQLENLRINSAPKRVDHGGSRKRSITEDDEDEDAQFNRIFSKVNLGPKKRALDDELSSFLKHLALENPIKYELDDSAMFTDTFFSKDQDEASAARSRSKSRERSRSRSKSRERVPSTRKVLVPKRLGKPPVKYSTAKSRNPYL